LYPLLNQALVSNLITGKENAIMNYEYCNVVRNDEKKCGLQGKLHVRKYIRKEEKDIKN